MAKSAPLAVPRMRPLPPPEGAPGGTGRLGPPVGEEAGPLGVRPLQCVREARALPPPSISWPLTLQLGVGIPLFSVKFAQVKAGVEW